MLTILTLFIIGTFALAYPILLSLKIKNENENKNNSIALSTIITNIILTIIFFIIIYYLLVVKYDDAMPSSSSSFCINNGGWIYHCSLDGTYVLPLLLITEIVIIIYNILSQICFYYLYKYGNNFLKYVYMYIHIIALLIVQFFSLIILYGLFISYSFNSPLVKILRFTVFISPTGLLLFSFIIPHKKQSNN